MKLALLLIFCCAFISSCISQTLNTRRPKELVFERPQSSDSAARACSLITLRETQAVRKLSEHESYISIQRTATNSDRFSIISYEEEVVWSKAQDLCQSFQRTPNFPRDLMLQDAVQFPPEHMDASQTVLNALPFLGDDSGPVQSPSLEIQPILQSGPSNNRVDLVFFSDGCMRFQLYLVIH